MMNLRDELLERNCSIVASNGYYSYENGIKPVLYRVDENREFFKGLTVADKVIGKASAMLLCMSGVKEVYALLLSKAGKEILERNHVPYHFDELVDIIVNNKGDGMCPMELTVKDVDDPEEAFEALKKKVAELSHPF